MAIGVVLKNKNRRTPPAVF